MLSNEHGKMVHKTICQLCQFHMCCLTIDSDILHLKQLTNEN